jgi:hypothetical protein
MIRGVFIFANKKDLAIRQLANSKVFLVDPTGLEPVASCLQSRRSTK